MACFEGTLFSRSLEMMTSVRILLPERAEKTPVPVLYLLHGISDDSSCWLRRTCIDRFAEAVGMAVMMPEVQRSYYCNLEYGPAYFTYVSQELPELCRRMFRVSDRREDTFIAGLSMGGYGALKTAMTYPEQYAAAASFSGAFDLAVWFERPEFYALSSGQLRPQDDVFQLVEDRVREGRELPQIYMSCGESDTWLNSNRRLDAHLTKLGVPHTLETWPGGHSWAFWNTSIQKALNVFTGVDRPIE